MTPREQLDGVVERMSSIVRRPGPHEGRSLAEAVGIVAETLATLLPADEAVDLPAVFSDNDGDAIRVAGSPGAAGGVRLYMGGRAVDIGRKEVDRFIAAVRAAAGR